MKAPPPKRRKLDENQNEKRKGEGVEEEIVPARKKQRKNGDIRVMMRQEPPTSPVVEMPHTARGQQTGHYPGSPSEEDPEQDKEQDVQQEQHGVRYGETQRVEMVDWEETFKKHQEETKRMEKERTEKLERAEKNEKSWMLLRECVQYTKENESNCTVKNL